MTIQARQERRVTIPNGTLIMLGAVLTTNMPPTPEELQSKVHKGSLAVVVGAGVGWHVCVGAHCHGASIEGKSSREVCAEILACIPNAHAQGSTFVLYMIKYIYTFICLMLFMQRKVFIYHFGEVCICCANQSVVTPVS